ncbi:MAG: hypothetical protein H7Y38_00625 [Armatimonadetes bacterium]|nr:hypothetical protein [Armatimonadota bacterium]
MPLYNDDQPYAIPNEGLREAWGEALLGSAEIDGATFFQTRCPLPRTALCLKVPTGGEEELVVHRENNKDYVFLFESLDDAYDYAKEASQALAFAPKVRRVNLRDLHFANARYKPALSEQVDLVLRH